MNYLITAIGSFSAAAVVQGLNAKENNLNLYGCDIFPKEWHHVSKEFKEVFLAPYVCDETEYFEFIKNIISEKNIRLIIPLTDIEIDFFNKYRSDFDNIKIIMGDQDFITLARDKERLTQFLKDNNFKYPSSYSFDILDKAKYPLIAKPKNGRSSEGVFILANHNELSPQKNYSNYIFQEIIEGDIITIDVLRNKNTEEIRLIPRKELIRTSNGAGMTVELFYDAELIQLATEISEGMKAHGVYNMEFIQSKDGYFLIDLNPRFSAGIGFTTLMEYNIIQNTLNLFNDMNLEPIKEYKNMIAQKQMIEVINEKI